MDGEIDIKSQVMSLRAAVGRKYMEIEDYEEKAENATGDEAGKCLDMIEFLKKDIAGYKTIIDDLKDGANDLTGNLWDIASLPEDSLDLYTNFYLDGLNYSDREDEDSAMELKSKYAVDLAKSYMMHVGRMALTDPKVLDVMLSNEELVSLIGSVIMDMPEIMNIMEAQ